jgi:hypothetical protein
LMFICRLHNFLFFYFYLFICNLFWWGLLAMLATIWPTSWWYLVMSVERLVEWELTGETKVLSENISHCPLSTCPTWLDLGSNLDSHSGKPV